MTRRFGAGARILLLVLILSASPQCPAGDAHETAGDILRIAIPAAALAVTVKRQDREGRMGFYKSFGVNVTSTWALKELTNKDRPDGSDDDAFPSGHASMAFQGAAFLHRRYGIRDAWIAYVLATYVGWTRVDADEHDTVDVLGGAALGIASSFLLNERRTGDVSLVPTLGEGYVGIRLSGRF